MSADAARWHASVLQYAEDKNRCRVARALSLRHEVSIGEACLALDSCEDAGLIRLDLVGDVIPPGEDAIAQFFKNVVRAEAREREPVPLPSAVLVAAVDGKCTNARGVGLWLDLLRTFENSEIPKTRSWLQLLRLTGCPKPTSSERSDVRVGYERAVRAGLVAWIDGRPDPDYDTRHRSRHALGAAPDARGVVIVPRHTARWVEAGGLGAHEAGGAYASPDAAAEHGGRRHDYYDRQHRPDARPALTMIRGGKP